MKQGLLAVIVAMAVSFPLHGEPQAPAQGLNTIVELLGKLDDPVAQADVLRGMAEALKGRREVPMPHGWHELYGKLQKSPSPEVRNTAAGLAIVFGDADAVAALRLRVSDVKADTAGRIEAIAALAEAHDGPLGKILLALLDDPALRGAAVRTLAGYSENGTAEAILGRYGKFTEAERKDAISTLSSRKAWGVALLDAVESGKIPHADVSAFTVRQLSGLHDAALDKRIQKFFGTVRPPAKDKAALISLYKRTFRPDMLAKANLSNGRAIFNKTCAPCHTLFDSGGHVGPELTGSQRANIDYVLENVVDPSAVVAKDYFMTVIETNDGRTITGIIKQETDKSLTIRDTTQDLTLLKTDIKRQKTSAISMMPEGLLEGLSTADARDLIGYLASPVQVPMK